MKIETNKRELAEKMTQSQEAVQAAVGMKRKEEKDTFFQLYPDWN